MSKKRELNDLTKKECCKNLIKKCKRDDDPLLQSVREALKENDMDKVKDLIIYDKLDRSWIESPKDPTTMYPLQHLCEPPKDTPLTKKSPSSLLVLKDKWTALHLACLKGHVDVVKELILNGADTSAKTNRENTALHIATQNNHFDVVTFLIQNGMDVNVRSWCLRTALHDASEYGCVDVAKVLLQNGADANIQMSFERKTPLLIAAMRKHGIFMALGYDLGNRSIWRKRENNFRFM